METERIQEARAILVGLVTDRETAESVDRSLDELERLLDTAGGICVARLTQNKDTPDVRTVLGSGKVAELAFLCARNDVTLVVFDCELSPSQIRNVEDIVGENVRVIDRSMLNLDIFALHAVTGEGKLQVELAQLKYIYPRLKGKGEALSRLGGGVGTRGPGETKLETDRRYIRGRLQYLETRLKEMEKRRGLQTTRRKKDNVKTIALVGYTNTGKSTLMNAFTQANVYVKNELFATLDPHFA